MPHTHKHAKRESKVPPKASGNEIKRLELPSPSPRLSSPPDPPPSIDPITDLEVKRLELRVEIKKALEELLQLANLSYSPTRTRTKTQTKTTAMPTAIISRSQKNCEGV
jgi:hypothetical protein